MRDRIGYRGKWRDNRDLTYTTDADRMARSRHLNDTCFDQREIEAGRHSIIEEASVPQNPSIVVKVLLVQRPANSLRCSTLHLTFNVTRMNRLADVLGDGCSEDLNLGGIRIDFDV